MFDSTSARVVVQVGWEGRIHKCEKRILPDQATHVVVDRELWDAMVQVRRRLAVQRYGDHVLTDDTKVPLRNEFELMFEVRNWLATHSSHRFELVPPQPSPGFTRWRAYFKRNGSTLRIGGRLIPDVEANPPVGVGGTDCLAIENLLRSVEGRDVLDG